MKEIKISRSLLLTRPYKDIPFPDMIVYEIIEEILGTDKFTIVDAVQQKHLDQACFFIEEGEKDKHRIYIEEYFKQVNKMKSYFAISLQGQQPNLPLPTNNP